MKHDYRPFPPDEVRQLDVDAFPVDDQGREGLLEACRRPAGGRPDLGLEEVAGGDNARREGRSRQEAPHPRRRFPPSRTPRSRTPHDVFPPERAAPFPLPGVMFPAGAGYFT